MTKQDNINFRRIAEALEYIKRQYKSRPGLEEVASHVHLSPFHFQRLFTQWAGVSPKQFLQYTSLGYARQILRDTQASLLEAAEETGLSGTGRLHDLFVTIEGMTPGEYRNGGENLKINYSYADSPFGELLVGSTGKGICHMAFVNERSAGLRDLQDRFPNAGFRDRSDGYQENALGIFSLDWSRLDEVKLHLRGTEFQLKVWEALLTVPRGGLTTYGDIAEQINKPTASRAVGSAVGSNPVAYLIPCHRVIQSTGAIGGYMWGPVRKTAMIGWEAAGIENPPQAK